MTGARMEKLNQNLENFPHFGAPRTKSRWIGVRPLPRTVATMDGRHAQVAAALVPRSRRVMVLVLGVLLLFFYYLSNYLDSDVLSR
jgi:hypothetical protein